jgi:hypothetical protein
MRHVPEHQNTVKYAAGMITVYRRNSNPKNIEE